MDYEKIMVGFHLIGFALGLGGATISDITFFKILKSRQLTEEKFKTLHLLSRIIWIGLSILIASGLIIFGLIYAEMHSFPLIYSSRWQTKLTLVLIILINGFVFRSAIFPALQNLTGQFLNKNNVEPIINRLAISGTVSIVSWYFIMVISLFSRGFHPPVYYFAGVYIILLIGGYLISKNFIRKKLS